MRFKLILILLYSFYVSQLFGQSILITDQATEKPIPDVFIYHADKEHLAYTDQKGMADLSSFPKGEIYLQHPSFYEQKISFDRTQLSVSLKEKIVSYNEVVVSANKWEQEESSISQQIVAVNKKEVAFQNPQTSADLLSNSGQVFVQKSQYGGGSPKIRGFAANSVLLVVDGVRMNNAIFRSGNLQNVINIDPNALQSAEVIFGPGSVIYGSDALGGVMDFHTVSPKWSSDGITDFSLNALSRFSTAAEEKTGHLDFSLANKKWTFYHSTTFSSLGDLRAGAVRRGGYEGEFERRWIARRFEGTDQLIETNEPNLQTPSGYDLFNSISKIKMRVGDKSDLSYGFYFSTTSNIPRYDLLTETIGATDSLANAEWYYGPQKWQMHSLRWNFYGKTSLFDQARATVSYQLFEESRNDRRFGDDRLRVRTEQVDMFSISFDFDKDLRKSTLYYGLDFYNNDINSSAFRRDIETNAITTADSRYPDGGSSFSSFAIYGSNSYSISKKLALNSGVRLNSTFLKASTNNERAMLSNASDIDLNNSAINGSLGLAYNFNSENKLSYNLASGFRAPNVDDIGKLFEVGNSLVVPNPDLEPEYSISNEIAFQKKKDQSFFKVVGFYSRLFNAIVDGPFELNGSSTAEIDGQSLSVFSKVNSGKAFIYGGSLLYNIEFLEFWAFSKTLSYTGGRDISKDQPLRHTTPIFGKVSLTYQKKKIRTELYSEYNSRRKPDQIPDPEFDRKSYLYTEEGTPAWYTVNLRTAIRISDFFRLNLAVENIMDRHYRPYTSGISAPGRNFIISAEATL